MQNICEWFDNLSINQVFSAYDSRLSHCESVQAAFQDPQLRPFFGWQILDDLGQIWDFWVAPMFAHYTRFIAWCPVIIHLIAMPLAAHNVKWFKPSNLVRREDVTHGEQTVAFSNDSSLSVPWINFNLADSCSMSLKAGPSKGLCLIRVTFCFRSCESERWPCFSATLPKSHVLGHTSLADRRIHRASSFSIHFTLSGPQKMRCRRESVSLSCPVPLPDRVVMLPVTAWRNQWLCIIEMQNWYCM